MTKRTYTIIIALLVALDIATGFWYFSNHVNSDGKGGDFFADANSSDDDATMADTIPDGQTGDKFELIADNAYFVSESPLIAGKSDTYYTSIKRFKAKVPTSINGNQSLEALVSALASKAFDSSSEISIETGLNAFLGEPSFNDKVGSYKKLESAPDIVKDYGNVKGIKIYPTFGSENFLVMAIDKTSYNGESTSERLEFVTFNRRTLQVMEKGEILNPSQEEGILALVNANIDKMRHESRRHLASASHLPSEIYPRRNGIYFVYAAGTIASEKEGIIEVFVGYNALSPYLTEEFNDIAKTNTNFTEYDPVTFAQDKKK